MEIKETKLVINAIDKSDSLFKRNSLFLRGAVTITSINDMVEKIISKASEEGGLNTIYRLNIRGHGAEGAQAVGGGIDRIPGKYLDTSVLTEYSDILGRLRPYFRKDAVVTLHGCEVAKGETGSIFLKKFSVILGVSVQAGENPQYPLFGLEGQVKRCTPIACGNPNQSFQKSGRSGKENIGGSGAW
jgi:hypothetical protein